MCSTTKERDKINSSESHLRHFLVCCKIDIKLLIFSLLKKVVAPEILSQSLSATACLQHTKSFHTHTEPLWFCAPIQQTIILFCPCYSLIDHFTVVCLVPWPLNESEAGVDLVLIETSLLFICKFPLISMRTASLT